MEQFSVRDRTAIVTGASSGLGERFAGVLADNGANVVAVARRRERLDDLAERHPGVFPVQADLLESGDRARVVTSAVERFGTIDILVNNAGGGTAGRAIDEPLDHFRRVIELNLTSVFELSQLAARVMIGSDGGSIINIASILGLVSSWPIPNGSYTASKGAVVNLTRELGCQWADQGIRVNAIAPGYFPSESTQDMIEDERAAEFVRNNCPMRRFGEADELDGALLFLASRASSYCTGQILAMDGGWTAR